MSPKQAKEPEISLFSQLGVPQTPQANNHNIYAEYLVQTYVVSTITTLVSVSPYEPYFVDFVGHILLGSSAPLATIILLPHLL